MTQASPSPNPTSTSATPASPSSCTLLRAALSNPPSDDVVPQLGAGSIENGNPCDIEDALGRCDSRLSERTIYVCEGGQCVPLRQCERAPVMPCLASEGGPSDLCRSWEVFTPQCKRYFQQGPVWVIAGPPCAGNRVCGPFADAMERLQGADGLRDDAADGQPSTINPTATAPWAYPRIKFTSDAEIALCEKAIGIFNRAPFLALVDLPHSTALVLDILQPASCTVARRTVNAFATASASDVEEFVSKAVRPNGWPKALLGERPPADDVDPETRNDLSWTFKAVQSTVPRLVRGEIRTAAEAKRSEALHASGDVKSIRAGPLGTGPLLVIFTLWAKRCPCCPPLIRLVDQLLDILASEEYRSRFPNCPLVELDATIRHVTLDVDENHLDDAEWPDAAENLEPISPSLGASPPPMPVPIGHPASVEVEVAAIGHPERTLPCVMTYRNGTRVGRFHGMRTPKNIALFVAQSFGLMSASTRSAAVSGPSGSNHNNSNNATIMPVGPDSSTGGVAATGETLSPMTNVGNGDLSWLYYLQSELQFAEETDNFKSGSMRKRSRSDRAL